MLNCSENLLGPVGAGGQRGSNAPMARERAFLNANQGHQARLIDSRLGEGGGGAENGRAMEGEAREEGVKGQKVRRGCKGGRTGMVKEKWSDEARTVLWECFVMSGGRWRGGYIRKVKEMWDRRGMQVRGEPSLSEKMKAIEAGGLTGFDKVCM